MAIRETHVETRPEGLTSAEVKERISKGETNQSHDRTSRTLGEIIRANVFTRFNAILAVLLAAVITTGEYKDGLFGIVLVFNALIGIVQEIKAKRTLDRLAVLSASGIKVVRDGTLHELAPDALVLDDIVQLGLGDQVPADGVVLEAVGLEIDESLLTGEADPIDKERDAKVMSGSFVVAGVGRIQTTAVGDDVRASPCSGGQEILARSVGTQRRNQPGLDVGDLGNDSGCRAVGVLAVQRGRWMVTRCRERRMATCGCRCRRRPGGHHPPRARSYHLDCFRSCGDHARPPKLFGARTSCR